MEVDLVAIGGGFAGLTAAVRASELGLTAVVLERGAEEEYRCNSRVATGAMHVGMRDPHEPAEVLFERIVTMTDGTAREDLARTFAGNAERTLAWMAAHGAQYEDHPRSGRPILAPPRAMCAGLDWRDKGPDRFLRALEQRLEARGGRVLRGTAAVSLLMDNGRCVGVATDGPDGPGRVEARAVILADGGFQASRELIGRYITKRPDRVRQRNTETGQGDGLRMAQEVGAALVGLEKFYGHVLSRDAMTNESLWPYPQIDVIAAHGIIVDAAARRFTDEGLGGVFMTNAIAGLDDPLSATAIFDATLWEMAKSVDTVPINPHLREAGGTVLEAASLDQVASLAGLDPAALRATVDGFNDAVREGRLDTLSPVRTASLYEPVPIVKAPYFAVPLAAGITVTMGGIAVDGAARVLRPDDTPIEGLYAAGSTIGGIEGGPKAGYAGGLMKAFLLGLVAAETAAGAR